MDSNIDNTNSDVQGSSMRDFMPSEEVSDTNQDVSEGGNNQGSTASVQDTNQVSEQTQKEETFTGNFDPNKLPPELQVAYKQMQADYTRKTQELAEARKFHEAYSQYAPLLSYIAENPQIVEAYLNGGDDAKPNEEQQDEVVYPDDPVEFAKAVKEEAKKEALQEFLNFYQQQKLAEEQEEAFIADADAASKVDERLEKDEEFADQVIAIMATDKDFLAGRKTAIEATREAVAKLDGFLSKRVEVEKQKLSELAKQKRSPLVSGSPMATEGQTSQPRTMREAAAEFLR